MPQLRRALRGEFRAFLDKHLGHRSPRQRSDNWYGFSREFSKAMGQAGYLGMTWPRQYGGHERSAYERYVVVEESLAYGAPVGAHWIADRQSGPSIIKFGTEEQKETILPRIVAGELAFSIGMSEPDSGSDLAATRTKAVRDGDLYRVTGTKVWTSFAHEADYAILFCRTSGTPADRHLGTSQLLVDLRNTPGLTIRPIIDLAGQHHFNEMHFEDAAIPAKNLLGEEGGGWTQVMSELAFERSGPERFLSSIELMYQLIAMLQGREDEGAVVTLGRVTAQLAVLRRQRGGKPGEEIIGHPARQAARGDDPFGGTGEAGAEQRAPFVLGHQRAFGNEAVFMPGRAFMHREAHPGVIGDADRLVRQASLLEQFVEQRAGRPARKVDRLDRNAEAVQHPGDVEPAAARIIAFAAGADLAGR